MAISFKDFSTAYDIHAKGEAAPEAAELQEILGYLKSKMTGGASDLKAAQTLLDKVKNGDKNAIAPLKTLLTALSKVEEFKTRAKEMEAKLLGYQRALQLQQKSGQKVPYDWSHVGKHD
jgi:hypothetical protein